MYSEEIHEKEKYQQNQPQTINKMAIGTYISIITLNVNVLNAPTKRHTLTGYKNKTHIYAVYKKPTSDLKTYKKRKYINRKTYKKKITGQYHLSSWLQISSTKF